MGQYFKEVIIDKRYMSMPPKVFCNWDWDGGVKLMEHCYEGNRLMCRFAQELVTASMDGDCRAAIVGDYCDEFLTHESTIKRMGYDARTYQALWTMYIKAWDTRDSKSDDIEGVFERMRPEMYDDTDDPWKENRIAIANIDRKEWMITDPKASDETYEEEGWAVNQLGMLLTAGNGAGGSYHGTNMDMVGRWAGQKLVAVYYDVDTVEYDLNKKLKEISDDLSIYDFTKLETDFREVYE